MRARARNDADQPAHCLIGTYRPGVHGDALCRVSTITEAVARTQGQLDKQVEHAVDREEYLRRDREIQRALERMATKDELRDASMSETVRSIACAEPGAADVRFTQIGSSCRSREA